MPEEPKEQSISIKSSKKFTLPRDAAATVVPAGHTRVLAEGEKVTLMQALGATATVTDAEGEMLRLSPEDSIEFGFVDPEKLPKPGEAAAFNEDQVWEAATTVFDPEIPVDIVQLGLVYKVTSSEVEGGGWKVDIDMSVTAPFCGMGDIMRKDLHDAVAALPGVVGVDVQMVFDPPWDVSRMSDVARLELGML